MDKSFLNTVLLFTVYDAPGPLNYVIFTLIFFLYVFTIFANVTLILVIYVDSNLHKPMYIFLLNLAVNGLIGCSTACPKVMDNLLDNTKGISYGGCLVQTLCINMYGTCSYVILAVMAYDRYVSICKPLQYHSIMTPFKVKSLMFVIYFIPFTLLSFQVYLTSRLPLCRYVINKLFCDNLAILKLSCVKSAWGNLYGVFMITVLIILPFLLIVLSYVKIFHVCLRASKESRRKALSTCAPHLIVFTNHTMSILFTVIYNRHSAVTKEINAFISTQLLFSPPLIYPLVYGIKTKEIRRAVIKMFRRGILARPETLSQKVNSLR